VLITEVVAGSVDHAAQGEEPKSSPAADLNGDLRLAAMERRIRDNDWRGIARDLGGLDELGKLPPNLGLLGALAHHEITDDGSQDAVLVGVRCVASILGVSDQGAMAGVIARRLFRKNPVRFAERKAPKARTSLLIVIATLVFGGGVGWLASGGSRTVLHAVQPMMHPHR
jgi:hypothetical protein